MVWPRHTCARPRGICPVTSAGHSVPTIAGADSLPQDSFSFQPSRQIDRQSFVPEARQLRRLTDCGREHRQVTFPSHSFFPNLRNWSREYDRAKICSPLYVLFSFNESYVNLRGAKSGSVFGERQFSSLERG